MSPTRVAKTPESTRRWDTRPTRAHMTTTTTRTQRPCSNGPIDSQPWTTSRCHRLLRQLESRVVALRKLVAHIDHHQGSAVVRRRPSKRTMLQEEESEQKRTRYTYSTRRKPKSTSTAKQEPSQSATTPPRSMRRLGAIKASHKFPFAYQNSFPTPVCRKFHTIQGQIKGSIDATPEMSYTKRVPRDLNDELQTFRNGSPEGRYRIYTGIFSWLCELLLSTEVKENEAHKKSLLGMCLRKIPACVDDIERWDRETSQDKVTSSLNGTISVSLEIYGQLEEFGAAGLGWRPLKQTVRAHGMSLLKKAVAEGLFDASFVGLLVRLCICFEGTAEAACLALAMPGPFPPPRSTQSSFSESRQLEPLGVLLTNTMHNDETRNRGAVFGCVSGYLREKHLPATWICSRAYSAVLTSAVESISQERTCGPVAVELLRTTTEMLANDGQGINCSDTRTSEKQQALIRLAAGLATAASNVIERAAPRGDSNTRTNPQRLLLHSIDSCIRAVSPIQQQTIHGRGGLLVLLLARFIAQKQTGIASAQNDADSVRLSRLISHMDGFENNTTQGPYRQMLQLVCSVAQGRSQAKGRPSYDCLVQVHSELQKDLSLPRWFLDGLATEGAFLLAQKTRDLRDLAFAERQIHPTGLTTTPGRTHTMFSGWRWEDGISEWVMRSPDDAKRGVPFQMWAAGSSAPSKAKTSQPHCRPPNTEVLDDDDYDDDDCEEGEPTCREGNAGRWKRPPLRVPIHHCYAASTHTSNTSSVRTTKVSSCLSADPHSERRKCNPNMGVKKDSGDNDDGGAQKRKDAVRMRTEVLLLASVQRGEQSVQQREGHEQGGKEQGSGHHSISVERLTTKRKLRVSSCSATITGNAPVGADAGAGAAGARSTRTNIGRRRLLIARDTSTQY